MRQYTDCVRSNSGNWLCWDTEKKAFVKVTFEEVQMKDCDPCDIKKLIDSMATKGKTNE